jgi:hypothetical protein
MSVSTGAGDGVTAVAMMRAAKNRRITGRR